MKSDRKHGQSWLEVSFSYANELLFHFQVVLFIKIDHQNPLLNLRCFYFSSSIILFSTCISQDQLLPSQFLVLHHLLS